MSYSMQFISTQVAKKFNEAIPGTPTENRVLIISPKEINSTKSGLIIPGQVKEGVPRKGVIIKVGEITEEYKTYRDLCRVGQVVTYGLYAGKELEFDQDLVMDEALAEIMGNSTITVLSLNEIVYSEFNRN